MLSFFPNRMVHLDFHTGPDIPDVGRDFDPDAFARTFLEARVDSVTLFAKCHHGHLYYDTDRPERHPGLPRDLDLLHEQIDALHRVGIHAPIYLSVQVDEFAAREHPEWCALAPDGRIVKRGGPLAAGWHVLDMSSPYQDYLAEQLAEVLAKFAPTDGIFLDMCWDQPSVSKWAVDGMLARGYDPLDPDDRARYAREAAHAYMARFKELIDAAHPRNAPVGIWFNSRPKTNLEEETLFLRHIEIECLPTGGWGYAYFPYVARFVRPLGLPTLSHTGRFHTSWGDFGGIKPEAALMYECCSILSQGMTSGVGDQLPPRGAPDPAAYDLIGKVYRHIEACEKWTHGGEPVSEAAVLIDPKRGDRPGPEGLGVIRSLQALRVQFDLISVSRDFAPYDLIIVPGSISVDAPLRERLEAFVAAGGAVLLSGPAALDADGKPALAASGIESHGESPFTVTYLRPAPAIAPSLPRTAFAVYERGFRMTPAARDAEVLAQVVEPYFERDYRHFCSHRQTPPAELSAYAAAVRNGRVLTFAFPVFRDYGRHGSAACRILLGECFDLLLPDKRIRDGGPAHLEATFVRTPQRAVVHLLSFIPSRRCEEIDLIEDPLPLVDMPLSVRLEQEPRRVFLAPGERPLDFTWRDGRAEVVITTTAGHSMVVFE